MNQKWSYIYELTKKILLGALAATEESREGSINCILPDMVSWPGLIIPKLAPNTGLGRGSGLTIVDTELQMVTNVQRGHFAALSLVHYDQYWPLIGWGEARIPGQVTTGRLLRHREDTAANRYKQLPSWGFPTTTQQLLFGLYLEGIFVLLIPSTVSRLIHMSTIWIFSLCRDFHKISVFFWILLNICKNVCFGKYLMKNKTSKTHFEVLGMRTICMLPDTPVIKNK